MCHVVKSRRVECFQPLVGGNLVMERMCPKCPDGNTEKTEHAGSCNGDPFHMLKYRKRA